MDAARYCKSFPSDAYWISSHLRRRPLPCRSGESSASRRGRLMEELQTSPLEPIHSTTRKRDLHATKPAALRHENSFHERAPLSWPGPIDRDRESAPWISAPMHPHPVEANPIERDSGHRVLTGSSRSTRHPDLFQSQRSRLQATAEVAAHLRRVTQGGEGATKGIENASRRSFL